MYLHTCLRTRRAGLGVLTHLFEDQEELLLAQPVAVFWAVQHVVETPVRAELHHNYFPSIHGLLQAPN